MIPREAARGASFMGAGKYYLHDRAADTSERVAFTHTENVPTNDPRKALKWMAFTAMHAEDLKRESGVKSTRRCHRPVYTLSLSWHPEQQPGKAEMIGAGQRALIALGLQDHETVMVAHSDRPHKHLHIICSVINPSTGRVNNLPFSRKKLSEWAETYELEHGKIYCHERQENNVRREQGEYVKHRDPEHDLKARITELYQRSDSGAAFQAGLKELGLKIAQGKRLVLIDREGKIHSLSRQIDGVTAIEIRTKLGHLKLPDVDVARKQFEAPKQQAQQQPKTPPRERPEPAPTDLNRLQNRHLCELGDFYKDAHRMRLASSARSENAYGPRERELRASIQQLENTLNNSGRVRQWWLKKTKQIPDNSKQALQEMQDSLANVEWRKSENQQAVETVIAARRRAIEARHAQERFELRPPEAAMTDQAPQQDEEHGLTFDY